MGENTMELKILGNRKELNRFYAYCAKNMHNFIVRTERFRPHGRQIPDGVVCEIGYEVGHIDDLALRRAYVKEMIEERKRNLSVI